MLDSLWDCCLAARLQVPDDIIKQLIREADTDGDGQISFQEFVNLMNTDERARQTI